MKESKKFFYNDKLNKGYKDKDKDDEAAEKIALYPKAGFSPKLQFLPDIEILERYEELHPGAARQLIEMARIEQLHRHSIEIKRLGQETKISAISSICSVILVVLLALVSFMMASSGYMVLALSLVAFSFFAILSAVILKKCTRSHKKNNTSFNKPSKYKVSKNQKQS